MPDERTSERMSVQTAAGSMPAHLWRPSSGAGPGADHAFDNPDFPLYDARDSALARERTVAFLARHLPAR